MNDTKKISSITNHELKVMLLNAFDVLEDAWGHGETYYDDARESFQVLAQETLRRFYLAPLGSPPTTDGRGQ